MTKEPITPEKGDTLYIKYGNGEWGYSGDKFSHFEGTMIAAVQAFANGSVRHTRGDERDFRVLRGAELFHVAMPKEVK